MRILTAAMLTALLVACGGARPDLRRLYEFGTAGAQPPVIVIPGILGSRLRDARTGEEIWPGSLWSVALGAKEHLALPLEHFSF